MRYIQKIYEDGRAIAIPVRQIVHVDLFSSVDGKLWYVDVYHTFSRDAYAVSNLVRMCEFENRMDAFNVYANILKIIAEENT